eukprot:403363255
MSFITFNHILELVGDEIFTMSKFEMAKIINEQLQHDIDHQVEYDIALQQSSQYLDTKRSEIFQEKDDSKNSFLSKGLWNTNLMIKYFPIKNNYKVYKTVQTMPKGSETILVRSDLAFVIGGYDTFSPNIITNTLFAFEFPEELNAREELKYDYVYELQQKAALIVKKVNYALVSSPSFICLIGGKISTGGDNQQLRITNLCEIYNINGDQWSILPELNVKRANSCVCLFNNKYIYVFGGESPDYPGFNISESIERLDLSKKDSSWQELDLGTIHGECWFSPKSQALQINDTQIYIFGGINTHKLDGEVGKSLLLSIVDQENEFECELKEKDRYNKKVQANSKSQYSGGITNIGQTQNYEVNIVCDQVCKCEYQIFGISSDAVLDQSTGSLKSIAQIDIYDILKSYNFM